MDLSKKDDSENRQTQTGVINFKTTSESQIGYTQEIRLNNTSILYTMTIQNWVGVLCSQIRLMQVGVLNGVHLRS
jgi:hypothetical protein